MNVSWYVSLMFASIIVGYLLGYVPLGWLAFSRTFNTSDYSINSSVNLTYSGYEREDTYNVARNIIKAIIGFGSEGWVALIGVAFLLTISSLFGAQYLGKLFLIGIALIVANLFVLPTSYLTLDNIPIEIRAITFMFYNTILFLFVIDLLRW